MLACKFFEDFETGDEAIAEEAGWRTYLVNARPEITGADVAAAEADLDVGTGSAHVTVELTPAAGARFAAVTKRLLERRIAIVVDHEVMSVPVIRSEIPGGHLHISMGSGPAEQRLAEAKLLAAKLRGE